MDKKINLIAHFLEALSFILFVFMKSYSSPTLKILSKRFLNNRGWMEQKRKLVNRVYNAIITLQGFISTFINLY